MGSTSRVGSTSRLGSGMVSRSVFWVLLLGWDLVLGGSTSRMGSVRPIISLYPGGGLVAIQGVAVLERYWEVESDKLGNFKIEK